MSVTADELKALVIKEGWRLEWSRRNRTRYAYAARGKKPHVTRIYLCGEHGLPEIKAEDIVAKLPSADAPGPHPEQLD